MNHTISEHRTLRLVHSRADPLGDLLADIERDHCRVRRPVPQRLYVLGYAVMLVLLLGVVLP